MKIDNNIWMFGLGMLGTASFSMARPTRESYFNTPITEFRDNYTANYMIDYAVAHSGNASIDPALLRPMLFNDKGFLDSQKLWDAWKKYDHTSNYLALKNSTNNMQDCNNLVQGELVTIPFVALSATAMTSFMALNDLAGEYAHLKDGELPNFNTRINPNSTANGSAAPPNAFRALRINSTNTNGCFEVMLSGNDTLTGNSTKNERMIFPHELNHATNRGPNREYGGDINWPLPIFSNQEPETDFFASLWTNNTQDNPTREITAHGQYTYSAIAAALDDKSRDTGNLKDLVIKESDLPEISPDGSSPPLRPGQYADGIDIMLRDYYRNDDDARAKMDHLTNTYIGSPNGTIHTTPRKKEGGSSVNWDAVIIGSVVGGAVGLAGIGTLICLARGKRRAPANIEDGVQASPIDMPDLPRPPDNDVAPASPTFAPVIASQQVEGESNEGSRDNPDDRIGVISPIFPATGSSAVEIGSSSCTSAPDIIPRYHPQTAPGEPLRPLSAPELHETLMEQIEAAKRDNLKRLIGGKLLGVGTVPPNTDPLFVCERGRRYFDVGTKIAVMTSADFQKRQKTAVAQSVSGVKQSTVTR